MLWLNSQIYFITPNFFPLTKSSECPGDGAFENEAHIPALQVRAWCVYLASINDFIERNSHGKTEEREVRCPITLVCFIVG
jgi:hypothetical protein